MKVSGLIASVAVLASTGAIAEETGTLDRKSPRLGSPYEERIEEFEAGQRYEITVESDDFDPMVELFYGDDADEPLVSDDDGGDGTNSALEFSPSTTGRYRVRIRSVNEELGDFSLNIRTLQPLPPPVRPTATSKGTMEVVTFEGRLSNSDLEVSGRRVDDYLIHLDAGKPAIIALDADDNELDPVIEVYFGHRSNGGQVASDDDGGEGRNSIVVFVPEKSGDYIVRATSVGDTSTGSYVLKVMQ